MQNRIIELNEEELEIYGCIKNLHNLKSFFLFAGAGSGKTHSLVRILQKYKKDYSQNLQFFNKQIAIITYTNAACDEIKARLDYDDTFLVSTIHSFVWDLVKPYQKDIKKWVIENISNEITELEDKINKTKNKTTKTYNSNIEKLASKKSRLLNIETIKKFSYEPNGTNTSKDCLTHSEVISMSASFLLNKPLMQAIFISKYPILLIDESQDTNKYLLEAFFAIQQKYKERFSLGLLGDIMQRIYFDGKEHLGENLPEDWITPEKKYNYRSCSRIIDLANAIRQDVDNRKQIAQKNKNGIIRCFIVNNNITNEKNDIENKIRNLMAEITNDKLWQNVTDVKTLTLEHHMAASRMGFSDFFVPLYSIEKYRIGILDGSLSEISFLVKILYELVLAKRDSNNVKIKQIVKKYSNLLSKERLQQNEQPIENLHKAKNAIDELFKVIQSDNVKLKDIVQTMQKNHLFDIPEIFKIALKNRDENSFEQDDDISAWSKALDCTFTKFEAYVNYILGTSSFDTHQGVKGLEFDRVMAIIDDEESKGFMFKYDKLFGINPLSDADIKNQNEGKETSIDRARRLFYVICTRAKESLAIVAYTNNPDELNKKLLEKRWFNEEEIMNI